VESDDVGVTQPSQDLGLLAKTRPELVISDQRLGQSLDGNQLPRRVVSGDDDRPRRARTKRMKLGVSRRHRNAPLSMDGHTRGGASIPRSTGCTSWV